MSGLEAVLAVLTAFAVIGVLTWRNVVGRERAWRRAVARRERLRAEIELQRLTHQTVLRMLAVARERYRPRP